MPIKKPAKMNVVKETLGETIEENFLEEAVQENSVTVKDEYAFINWEEQLAKEALIAADIEKNTGGGKFFSIQSGILSFNKQAMPGNQIVCIILDAIFENLLYEPGFDSENIRPPICYAMSRSDTDLKPEPEVFELDQAQNDTCKGCEFNEYNTAHMGRGKACGNKRRLAVIPAGNVDENGNFTPFTDADDYTTSSITYYRPQVTSTVPYAEYVKRVSALHKRPPFAVITRMKVVPDPKTQHKTIFEFVAKIPLELMPVISKRREEAQREIMFKLNLEQPAEREKPVEREKPTIKGSKAPASAAVNNKPTIKRKY